MPEDPEPVPENNALAVFLRHAQSAETIDARFESDESAELGEKVAALLEPAPVTDAFKEVIAYEVRRAHAWRGALSDAVAPDRLGLLSGSGLFDPVQAQEIEAQALRSYLAEMMQVHAIRIPREDDTPALEPGGTRPRDFTEALERLERWVGDFREGYEADPFDGMDLEAFEAAAPEIHVMTAKEATGWSSVFERLRELREDDGDRDDL